MGPRRLAPSVAARFANHPSQSAQPHLPTGPGNHPGPSEREIVKANPIGQRVANQIMEDIGEEFSKRASRQIPSPKWLPGHATKQQHKI